MMKKQIWVIHGGDAFEKYEDYIAFLKSEEITLEDFKTRRWKTRLSEDLGVEFEVFSPRMPNPSNAKYVEWKIWFEKLIPLMAESVVLLGHSLGGIFLAKYLSENDFPKHIEATFLVAAPYDESEHLEKAKNLFSFIVQKDLARLVTQGGQLFLYQSKDDPLVSFSELEKYTQALPKARVHIFEDRGHFAQEQFPEIIEDIKSL